jgi:hypothetical protein
MNCRLLASSGLILALWTTSVSGEPRRRFLEDQFQGVASATLQLSGRLARPVARRRAAYSMEGAT